jgi:hypothetical protein
MAFNAKRHNAKAFTGGAWVEIMGGRFKVARAGNLVYQEALEKSRKRKYASKAEEQESTLRAIAEGILKDWEEIEDADGKTIPYSIDNAVVVLEENPDLLTELLAEANNLDNFRAEDIEEQGKKP